jgi:parvulin-like peptidyl-prolyl isomerase
MFRRTGLAAIAAALLAIYTGLASGQPAPSTGGAVAAVVNGVEIRTADVEARLKMMGPAPANLPEMQKRQRWAEALGMLIDEVLMKQFLEKTTPAVAPAEVAKQISAIEAGLKEQGKSMAEFLHDSYRTAEQFKADIADHLRWTAYCAKQYPDSFVEQYYKDNKDVFDKVYVQASHIVLRVPRNAPEAEKRDARAKLEEIRKKLLANPPADFAALAKQYSQGPEASKGGDLGWFPRKWYFDEEFSRAAFALPVGQVSEVVQTDFGYHLIKVTERKPGEKSDFSKIKEAVRAFCEEDMRQQLLAEQRKTATINLAGK